jgi:hypothetical protein
MTADLIAQIGVAIFGTTGVWLLASKEAEVRRWGYVSGLVAEPFWLYGAITTDQWGVVLMVAIYTVAWIRGIRNSFF